VERVADRIGILVDGILRVDCTTEHFKESLRKVVLEFPQAPPAFPVCQGLVSNRQVGHKLEAIIVGFNDEHRRLAESLHPRSMEVIELNLEDAFIEYTRGPRRALPIFSGEQSDD
jgi:ABC-2 type transport system ATP-binding protein